MKQEMSREESVAYAICKASYEQQNRGYNRDGPLSETSLLMAVEREFLRPWWTEKARAAIKAYETWRPME